MAGYVDNIEATTQANAYFRQVVFTGTYLQLVVMCLQPGEEIGLETHHDVDQFFRFESGQGQVVMNGEVRAVTDGSAVVVPAGVAHNIVNTSTTAPLKLYTVYGPPNHPEGTVHKNRDEALAAEAQEHGLV